jgi:hypothetical protein
VPSQDIDDPADGARVAGGAEAANGADAVNLPDALDVPDAAETERQPTETVGEPPAAGAPRRGGKPAWQLAGAALALLAGGALLTGAVVTGQRDAARERAQAVAPTPADDAWQRAVWRDAPVTAIFPGTLTDASQLVYRRQGIAPATGCGPLPAALRADLRAVRCTQLLRATYLDTTRTVLVTVGVLVLDGSADDRQRLLAGWLHTTGGRSALMPDTYPVPGTAAAAFPDSSRVAWGSAVASDGSLISFAVAGFADGRSGATNGGDATSANSDSSPPRIAASDLPEALMNELDDIATHDEVVSTATVAP